jgi:D-alanyl-D-alanine carboxypeptidase
VTSTANAALLRPNANGVAVEPLHGYYSPNTTITQRGDELWFIRPPYESPLVPNGDGTFVFAQGWLSGKLVYFTPNETGGVSLMLLSDAGTWNEFARSGEIYTDLDPALRGALEQVLEEAVSDSDLPGALLYVHIPGQGMWIGARGLADTEHGIPMVPHDRMRVASVTKTFVATVVLQLVEEGYLTLDDTIEQWMPGLVPNGEHITLRQLLNHTSGVYNYLDDGFVDRVVADPARIWTPQEIAMYAVVQPPYFSPGESWYYSNTNYILLGMVVEHATGVSLADQVYWRILAPLELNHTYFDPDERQMGGVIQGYVWDRNYTNLNMSFAWAAGGMVSTVQDLGRFMQALSRGELLREDTFNAMHTFDSGHGAWGASHFSYGLGMMQDVMSIAPLPDGQPRPEAQGMVRGHTGGLTGYRTAMWYLPDSGITIVVGLNQMFIDPNILVTDTMDTLLAYQDQMNQAAIEY